MKLTCIQMDMVLGAPDANFARAEALVRRAAEERPDVIVLPETWNTGFFPEDLAAAADVDGARTKSVFGPLARELGVNIVCGSTAVRRGEAFYNAAHIFDRSGALIAEYDKTHLFSPSGEDAHFRAGDKLCLFELDGRPCGLIICYDLRFPELARTLALKGAEMLFVVSQWPEARVMHLEALSRARAIENQMFVCLCNSAASDTRCGGHSALIAPDGTYLAHAGAGEALLTGEADFSVIDGIRSSINVFRDRRAGLYRLDEHPRGTGNAPAGADIIRPSERGPARYRAGG
jgi:predicted amidohydrolase